MKTAVYLKPTLESVYLLWHLLTNTSDVVVAYYFYLPYRTVNNKYSTAPTVSDKDTVNQIVTKLQSIRSFTFEILDLSNYVPKWVSVNNFELIRKASTEAVDQIAFPDMVEDVDLGSIHLKTASSKVLEKEGSVGTLVYPLQNLGRVDAVSNMPADILDLLSDPTIEIRQTMLGSGIAKADIISRETSFRNGTHARSSVESDGCWYVDRDEYFGLVVSDKPLLTVHPYFTYLTIGQ